MGFDGNDTLIGGAGNDSLDGSMLSDTMSGGAGNDTYLVDDSKDLVTELAGGGIDLVQASVTHILAGNVENMTLTGVGNIDGKGNALNNLLVGNDGSNWLIGLGGNDTLSGGAGADALTGGAGNDVYFVDNQDDAVSELAGEGKDVLHSTVGIELQDGQEIETLILHSDTVIGATGNKFANSIGLVGAGSLSINALGGNDTATGGAKSTFWGATTATTCSRASPATTSSMETTKTTSSLAATATTLWTAEAASMSSSAARETTSTLSWIKATRSPKPPTRAST